MSINFLLCSVTTSALVNSMSLFTCIFSKICILPFQKSGSPSLRDGPVVRSKELPVSQRIPLSDPRAVAQGMMEHWDGSGPHCIAHKVLWGSLRNVATCEV